MSKEYEPLFKAGDVCDNGNEQRMIIDVDKEDQSYGYFTKHKNGPYGWHYNPYRSAVGFKFMDQTYKKIGAVKLIEDVRIKALAIRHMYNDVHREVDKMLNMDPIEWRSI